MEFDNEDGLAVKFFPDPERKGWDIEVWCSAAQARVKSVFVQFRESKSREEVERLFHLQFRGKSYKWDNYLRRAGSAPVYEVSGSGDLDLYEDRKHGAVGIPDGVRVRMIEFPDHPAGSASSRCP